MEFSRRLNLAKLLQNKSFFLLGPRSTGKSTLIRQQLSEQALIIDLLADEYAQRLSAHPQELEAMVAAASPGHHIVIDEIQKIPQLLDTVHRLIEQTNRHFLLTGSSARKLRGNQSNLLAGRAWMASLFPLCSAEIPNFSLERYLQYGGLPQVYTSAMPHEELQSYIQMYLYEEIRAEALVRKLPAFSRFLEVAALSSGHMLNFTEIGNDAQVAPSTVREYYQVLEDTLMGTVLPAWTKSKKRKAIQTAKFYFFDIGVVHQLCGQRALSPHSTDYGRAFEHFCFMELRAYLAYRRIQQSLSYWRSVNGQEVDFILGDNIAIEIKSTKRVTAKHMKGLRALQEEGICTTYYLVSHDPIPTKHGAITCLPWKEFLNTLWAGDIV